MYEKYSVLFVDDEENILKSIRRALMDEEYTCYFAQSGKEALELMSNQKIDVIISDMRMPEMNGLELLKMISERWPNTVKIVLTGYTQLSQILVTVNQVDIFKFLTKPWTIEELTLMIRKALDYFIIQEENANYKKVLETKNQAYQNILKKMDDVMSEAKRSSEILGLCGKAILGFGKNFDLEQKQKYNAIFYMQDEIFGIFSKAVTCEKKEYDTNELSDVLVKFIMLKNPEAKIEKKDKAHYKLTVNIKMLEAIVSTIFIVFEKEFRTHGLFLNVGVEEGKKFAISIVSPRVYSDSEVDEKIHLTLIDIKIDFIRKIINEALGVCDVGFKGVKINDNLLIGLNLER
jgi:response regulator RpfG family c-di-GMP phosphodiesterase